jgi:uridine kinase
VNPKVIGLSSYTAGGKTTLARRLAELLNAPLLIWDDYDEAGFMTHPKDWCSWLAEGASSNAWSVPRLAQDLAKLKRGEPIISVVDGSSLSPTPYILFEAPLGYEHLETGKHIDFMVFIDTPLDVAMARRVLRDYFGDLSTLSDELAMTLKSEMESYLEFSRAAYLNMDKTVKLSADLIVDGTLPVETLATQILERLETPK